jgi:predicted ATPase
MCPRLHILATSREPLGAAGESRWPLLPLTVPPLAAPAGAWPTAEQDGAIAAPGVTALLAGSEAMQFFLDRARAVLPGFEITDDNAELIGQLCRRLDGLPLALEPAAAKLRVMRLSQVLPPDDVFKLLVEAGRAPCPAPRAGRAD